MPAVDADATLLSWKVRQQPGVLIARPPRSPPPPSAVAQPARRAQAHARRCRAVDQWTMPAERARGYELRLPHRRVFGKLLRYSLVYAGARRGVRYSSHSAGRSLYRLCRIHRPSRWHAHTTCPLTRHCRQSGTASGIGIRRRLLLRHTAPVPSPRGAAASMSDRPTSSRSSSSSWARSSQALTTRACPPRACACTRRTRRR